MRHHSKIANNMKQENPSSNACCLSVVDDGGDGHFGCV
jgi:hypothetical protein